MNTVFILMDSLNRHYLGAYGDSRIRTPNIDRLAERGIVFDNHYAGSLPCMPARREMMTGRYNFLETPWGPIEPWDDCAPERLREHDVYAHMITDHYHYFHAGGEGYHTLFSSWEFMRGQEGDVWRPVVDAPPPPPGTRGKGTTRGAYWRNRACRDPQNDEDYSTPQCFAQAAEFVERNHASSGWHLHLEVFDPHEPFECPDRYRDMYDDEWNGPFYNWPAYAALDPEFDDEQAVAHIRKSYAGALTMADVWLGKFLDTLDRYDLWQDTTIILGTDHGHLLGEHGYWAKNYMMDYAELVHTPMIMVPAESSGSRFRPAGTRVDAVTATVDLAPTLLDLHGAAGLPQAHGSSFLPILTGDAESIHDAVLYGYFGKDINMTDGRHTYCRQPEPDSIVHHHTAMPRGFSNFLPRERLEQAECGRFLESAGRIPQFRIPVTSHRHADAPDFNPIYDIAEDPEQSHPIRDPALEETLAERMRSLLDAADAPESQYRRVGL